MAGKRQRERVSLPWERRGGRLRRALSSTRWQALLASVILIVAGIAFAGYAQRRVRIRNTSVAIGQVKLAIDRFRADVGRCPSSETELLHPPLPQKHYLDAIPTDGWGRPLYIRCPGHYDEEADVISAGPSGSLLKDDNIQ